MGEKIAHYDPITVQSGLMVYPDDPSGQTNKSGFTLGCILFVQTGLRQRARTAAILDQERAVLEARNEDVTKKLIREFKKMIADRTLLI